MLKAEATHAAEEVAVGQANPVGGAGAAAGHHPAVRSSMSCSPSSGRSASVWVSWPASSRSIAGPRPRDRRSLARRRARAQRQQRPRRASSARGPARPARGAGAWSSPRSSRGGRRRRRGGGRPRWPRPRARRRSTSEPSVTSGGAVGQLCARWASQLSSFISSAGYRAHHAPNVIRKPRPSRISTRRSSGRARRVRATSATRWRTGSPRSRSTGPGATTPSGRRRWSRSRPRSSWHARTPRSG